MLPVGFHGNLTSVERADAEGEDQTIIANDDDNDEAPQRKSRMTE